MIACLFPGQGSQEVGMGVDLFRSDAWFRSLVQAASDLAGADLESICLRGPPRELGRTRTLQPLLVAISLGYHRHLLARGISPGVVLGHSLGEVSALAAAEVVTPPHAVAMAAKRGELMDACTSELDGGMIAVVTPHRDRVEDWLKSTPSGRELALANDNAPEQIVVSGSAGPLDELARFVSREHLGRCRRLPVSGPWHSPRLREARARFADWLRATPFREPSRTILFNVTAAPETNPAAIQELAVRNLTEPVRWRETLARLKTFQPRALCEVGPGRVLSGLARLNGFGADMPIFNVNNLRGVDLAGQALGR
jgi:[acyl-carrier-protein] S-malonyltransferase